MNRVQLIMFGGIGVIVFLAVLVVFDVIPLGRRETPPAVTITVWGFEDERLWQDFVARYASEFPRVKIVYTKKNPTTYERELLNALASGVGPDIFTLSNNQIITHGDKIFPLPEGAFSFRARDFRNTFFNASAEDLVTPEGKIVGIPLTVDTLALFYNRDFFNSANIASPPKTWEDLVDVSLRLTAFTEVGNIVRSGVALGTAANIEHAVDILSALMIETGVELVDRKSWQSGLAEGKAVLGLSRPAVSALSFYSSFADSSKRTYAWSSFFPNSFDAFAEGKTAIVFGYAEDIPRITAKNPHINFDVASFPQPKDAAIKIYYGRYRFKAVAKQSRNPIESWRFLLWLSGRDNDKIFAESQFIAPARRDLLGERPTAEYLEIFYGQVLAARTWLIPDENKINEIFKEMITSVVNKSASVEDAVGRANVKVNSLLNQP